MHSPTPLRKAQRGGSSIGVAVPSASASTLEALREVEETYEGGDRYEGTVLCDSMNTSNHQSGQEVPTKHGTGKYTFSDGSYYFGQWVRGAMEGKGCFFEAATGDQFDGTWRAGARVQGVYRFANGDMYIGAFDAASGSRKAGPAIVLDDCELFRCVYDNDRLVERAPADFTAMGGAMASLGLSGGVALSSGTAAPSRRTSDDGAVNASTRTDSRNGRVLTEGQPPHAADPPPRLQARGPAASATAAPTAAAADEAALCPADALDAARAVLKAKRDRILQRQASQQSSQGGLSDHHPGPFRGGTSFSQQSSGRSGTPVGQQRSRDGVLIPRGADWQLSPAPRSVQHDGTPNNGPNGSMHHHDSSSAFAGQSSGGSPRRESVTRSATCGNLSSGSIAALQRGYVDDIAGVSTAELQQAYRFHNRRSNAK